MISLSQIRQSSLARNAGWMFVGQGLSVFVQAIYFVLVARLLGSEEYGVFVGAMALVVIVSQYCSLGSGFVMLRYVSQDHRKFPEYWGNVLLTILLFGSLMIVLLRLFGPWWIGPSSASILLLVALGECTCARIAECAGQAFQAFEKLRITATLTTLTNVARLAAAAIMLVTLHKATVHQWAVASVCVSVVSATIGISTVTALLGRPKFRPRLIFSSAAEGLGFSFAASTTSVYNDIDKTMLSRYGMAEANGIYSMAYRVIDVAYMPIRSIHAAAFPRFFKKGANGIAAGVEFAKRILGKTTLYALVAAVGMALCAPMIPVVLGKSFADSVSALRWLCFLPFFRCFHISAGDSLTGAGYQNRRTACQVVVAGMNFGLNLWLIPIFSWKGAAMASIASDGLLAILNWSLLFYLLRKERLSGKQTVAAQTSIASAA